VVLASSTAAVLTIGIVTTLASIGGLFVGRRFGVMLGRTGRRQFSLTVDWQPDLAAAFAGSRTATMPRSRTPDRELAIRDPNRLRAPCTRAQLGCPWARPLLSDHV
jgi:hypothetical protein